MPSHLATSYLPWLMDLMVQVAMQYCSLQHQTYFHNPSHPQLSVVFALAPFLDSFWSYFYTLTVAYRATTDLGSSSLSVLSFCLFIPFRGFLRHSLNKYLLKTSLVVQWWRIHLPMQGTWVWPLVWEDPTCHGATKPMCCDYLAHGLEPVLHNERSQLESSSFSLQLEKACLQQWRPRAAKNK